MNVLLIVAGALIGFGILAWVILMRRNSSQEIQRQSKPIFPQPVIKNQPILFGISHQVSNNSDGLIDAGVQVDYLVMKNKKRLILYTSTDPVNNLLECLNAGKSAYITAWVSSSDDQDKELARIRIQIKKESKKDGFVGHTVKICPLTILDFNISTVDDFDKLEMCGLFLEYLEIWGKQFGATDILGEVDLALKNEFGNQKYHLVKLSPKIIRVTKSVTPEN